MAMNVPNGAPLSLGPLALASITEPRRVAATLASGGFSRGVGLLMALAGAVILAAAERLAVVLTGFDPVIFFFEQMREQMGPEAEGLLAPSVLEIVIVEVTMMMVLFAFISTIASLGGAAFGGKARPETIVVLTGWWVLIFAFVRSVLLFLGVLAPGPLDNLIGVVVIAASFYTLYLYGAFIAEAHGFASAGLTLLAGIALSVAALLGFGLISSILLGLFGAA